MRVLDRHRRLRRKSLDQIDGVRREGSRRFATDHQQADDVFSTDERGHQPRAVTGTQCDLVQVRGRLLLQVGDLDQLAPCQDYRDVRFVDADIGMRERVNQLLIHAVGGAQMKLALLIVEDIDRSRLGAGELHCFGDDGGEHGFEIERRVHRLRHFAECAQLLDRAAKFIGALAQLVQQSRIFDGDDGLRGEACDQRDLLLRKGTDFLPGQQKRTDRFVLLQHRNSHVRPYTAEFDGRHIFRATFDVALLCCGVDDVQHRPGRHHATEGMLRTGPKRCEPTRSRVGGGHIMSRNETYGVAFDAVDATKLGIADADGVLQHGCKHRLQDRRESY